MYNVCAFICSLVSYAVSYKVSCEVSYRSAKNWTNYKTRLAATRDRLSQPQAFWLVLSENEMTLYLKDGILDTNSFFILCHIEFVYPLRRPSLARPPPHICLCWAALSLSSSCCCNVRGVFVKSQMLMCGLKTPFEVLVNFIPECCCCVADGCCMHFGFRFPLEA